MLSSCEVMEFAVIGHFIGVVDLPLSLLMVFQARRLKFVIDGFHGLCPFSLHLSLSLVKRLFTKSSFALHLCGCVIGFHIQHHSMECSLCIHLKVRFSWQKLAASCSTIHRHCSGLWRVEVGG